MVARTHTVAFLGLEARPVEVQCALSPGLPGFAIVGLPDKAVTEARDRVRSALGALSVALPTQRITVNLAPADLPKEGSHFDLPIALALLTALGLVPPERANRFCRWANCRWTERCSRCPAPCRRPFARRKPDVTCCARPLPRPRPPGCRPQPCLAPPIWPRSCAT